MERKPFPGADRVREQITDYYIIILFSLFPLFPGFSGYQNITLSKYVFFLASTGLWLAALLLVSLRFRSLPGRPGVPQLSALVFLAVCLLSWLISPWRRESFLGAGRFDGLLTLAGYVLCFLGVSTFSTAKLRHAAALAVGLGFCCALGVLQLFGRNPLGLFPGGLSYFDAGTLYTGVYLGTIGNTNLLDAALCVVLPLCFTLYVCGQSPLFLLPLLPGCFLAAFAGGSGALVAYAVFALAVGPLALTDLPRLRRALRAGGLALASAGLALAYCPDYTGRVLTPRFALSAAPAALLLAAVAAAGLSFLHLPRFAPSSRGLRRFFLLLDAAAVLGGFALLYFYPWRDGTLYELSRVLHGELDDRFGSSRILIWRGCLALVPDRPLLGGGPGTLALRLDIRFTRFVPETGNTLASFVDNAHNIYLGYLVNCGILGLAAYLGLLCCGLLASRRAAGESSMAGALALSALCAAVHGFFGLGLCISEPFFWIVLALLCASSNGKGGIASHAHPKQENTDRHMYRAAGRRGRHRHADFAEQAAAAPGSGDNARSTGIRSALPFRFPRNSRGSRALLHGDTA